MTSACTQMNVQPNTIQCVEAHGTGNLQHLIMNFASATKQTLTIFVTLKRSTKPITILGLALLPHPLLNWHKIWKAFLMELVLSLYHVEIPFKITTLYLKKYVSWSLVEELKRAKANSKISQTDISPIAIFSLQIAFGYFVDFMGNSSFCSNWAQCWRSCCILYWWDLLFRGSYKHNLWTYLGHSIKECFPQKKARHYTRLYRNEVQLWT